MSYCEGDADLLKYDTIEDYCRFLVMKFIILSAVSDTWDWGWASANPFLRQYRIFLNTARRHSSENPCIYLVTLIF